LPNYRHTVNNPPIWFPLIHGDVTTMPCVLDMSAAELHLLFILNGKKYLHNIIECQLSIYTPVRMQSADEMSIYIAMKILN